MAITRRVFTQFEVDVKQENMVELLDTNPGTMKPNPILQLSLHPNSTHYECHRPYPHTHHDHRNSHVQSRITGPTIELELYIRSGGDSNILYEKFFELLATLEVSRLKKMAITIKIYDAVIDSVTKIRLLNSNLDPNNKWIMIVELKVFSVILYSDEYWREYCHMVPATESSIANLERRTQLSSSENLTCTICLEKIHEGFTVTSLPCLHEFHDNCIVRWLNTSHYCPLCRFIMPHN